MKESELNESIWSISNQLADWKHDVRLSGKEEDALQDLFREYEQLARKLFLFTKPK